MESKKPWESKTIVLNALIGLGMVAALFVPNADAWVQGHADMLGIGVSVLNVVLRFVSKGKIDVGSK